MKHLKRKLQDAQLQYSLKMSKQSTSEFNSDPSPSANVGSLGKETALTEPHELFHRQQHQCVEQTTLIQLPSVSSHKNLQFTTHDKSTSCDNGLFSGMQISDLLFIEIFAGSGKLTKAARVWQFETMAIDKTVQRSSGTRITVLDLSDPDEAQSLLNLIRQEHHRIVAIHLAPACGTASKAREKKLRKFSSMGVPVPEPLRSHTQPMGKDGLGGLDKLRTELANQVYGFTAMVMELCISLNILCSVENPENSLFWEYPDLKHITARGFFTTFHNCMHGGKRKKSTSWWATKQTYKSLEATCDNKHEHSSWVPTMTSKGLVFPTAEEAAYPELLCKRVAAVLHEYALQEGAVEPQDLPQQVAIRNHTSHRWILDMLPRGKKFKPLVSEFAHYVNFAVPASFEPEQSSFFKQQPKGTRVTARHLQRGCIRVDDKNVLEWTEVKTNKRTILEWASPEVQLFRDVDVEVCTVGIPREPWEFIQKAVQVGHPRSMAIHLSQGVIEMLEYNFKLPPHLVVKKRADFIKKWTNRCLELKEDERDLHQRLEPHVRHVLQGKRLKLFQEILDSLSYPDRTLCRDLQQGFRLTGWLERSGVFPQAMKKPEKTIESALRAAKGLNKSILKQVSQITDMELAKEVWDLTKTELERGWVFIDESCDPSNFLLGKRFGLRQKDKTRLIDDCSIGGFNETCGTSERLKVHTIDEMAAYMAWVIENCGECCCRDLTGRTYDLKSAYKQFAISSRDRDLLRIACWDDDRKQTVFLGLNALPFGAIGSVSAFLRISMAIWYVGVVGLHLCWSAFFDDYTLVSKSTISENAGHSAEALFTLLGIVFAREGSKAVEFSRRVKSLGVVLDLEPSDAHEFFMTIGHTESRINELADCIQSILDAGLINPKDAERLRGRMQWYESFAFGRVAYQPMKVLSRLSTGREHHKLSGHDRGALVFLKDRVLNAPPVRISRISMRTTCIFTDGSCEGTDHITGGVGGVLINEWGVASNFFSGVAPKEVMGLFTEFSTHPIFELELLPAFISIYIWKEFIAYKHCVLYVDNEAAQGALIKGSSDSPSGAAIVSAFTRLEMELQLKVWVARVPTSSNIADGPSRGDCDELKARNLHQNEIPWKDVLMLVDEKRSLAQ